MPATRQKDSAVAWGFVGAACAGLLTYVTSATSLALVGVLGAAQVGFLVGAVVGMVARSVRSALAASAICVVVGVAVFPPWFYRGELATLLLLLVVGVGVSGGVRAAIERELVRPGLVAVVTVGLAIACMLLVASSIATSPDPGAGGMSELQQVSKRPGLGDKWTDSKFYQVVVWKMRDGTSFLTAFKTAYRENPSWRNDPFSVFAVRPPLMFYFWKSLPDPWSASAFWALLALVCLGMVMAPVIAARSVSSVVGVAGAMALADYVLGFAFKPGLLFMFEPWAGAFAVLVLGMFALATGGRGWGRGLMVAAAALAVVTALARELMVFLLIAGLMAAFFAPKDRRRFDVTVWASALVGFGVIWAVELASASAIVKATVPMSRLWFAHGGLSNLVSGLVIQTWAVGGAWVSVALVLLGIAGAAVQRDRQLRVFALAAVLMPLVGFLFVGTNASSAARGPYNYWGAIVLPLLYVLAPAAVAWIPSMDASSTAMSAAPGAVNSGGPSETRVQPTEPSGGAGENTRAKVVFADLGAGAKALLVLAPAALGWIPGVRRASESDSPNGEAA
jgi:hypothetical protein